MKAAAIGIGVLDGAVKTVSGIIGDMDTTIMFASAGTLNADNDGEEFAGNVWKTIKVTECKNFSPISIQKSENL